MKERNPVKALDSLARAITLMRGEATKEEVSEIFILATGANRKTKKHGLLMFGTERLWGLVTYHVMNCIFVDDSIGGGDEQCEPAKAASNEVDSDADDADRTTASYICLDNKIRTYDEDTGKLLGSQTFILDEDELDSLTGQDRWNWFFSQSVRMGSDQTSICFQNDYFSRELNTIDRGGSALLITERFVEDCVAYLAEALVLFGMDHNPKIIRQLLVLFNSGMFRSNVSITEQFIFLKSALRKYSRSPHYKPSLTVEEKRTKKFAASPYVLVVFPESNLVVVLDKNSLNECFRFSLTAAIGERPYDHSTAALEVVLDYFVSSCCVVGIPRRISLGRLHRL